MKTNIIAILLVIASIISMSAQSGDNSPYSKFGIGEISDDHFHNLRQMGGLGNSIGDAFHINIVNPASYSFLRTTAFDLGLYAKKNSLTSGDLNTSQWTGNLEYISLGFPLFNPRNQLLDREKKDLSIGMAFTLKPHSKVGYDIEAISTQDSIGTIVKGYSGEGGSYKFLWGNSVKYKNLSFGVNLGYLFGKIKYNRNLDFIDLEQTRVDRFTTEYNMKGFLYDLGLIYTKTLNIKELEDKKTINAKTISVGLTFNSATGFNTKSDIHDLGIFFIGNTPTTVDTALSIIDQEGKGNLPGSSGIGVSFFDGEKYGVGVDFTSTSWDNYYNDANNDAKGTLSNTSSLAIGGYIRPNYKSYTSYWKRVYYRFGLYHRTDPRVIDGTQIKTQGFTTGMGLPFVFQRKISHAEIGFDFGRSGMGTPIEEKYVRINFGFTFNDDEWFVKRKYN